MKRTVLVVFLLALGVLNFLFAAYPKGSYFRLFTGSESLRRAMHIVFGIVFLLAMLLLIYGPLMPTVAENVQH